jgi:hypothetical protein
MDRGIASHLAGNPSPMLGSSTGSFCTKKQAYPEKGTDAFNAHDIDGFAEALADDVVFQAPGGMRGSGKPACVEFFGGWFSAFPDAHVEVTGIHFLDDIAVEEGTFTGTHNGVLRTPADDVPPTGRAISVDYIHVLQFRDGDQKRSAIGEVGRQPIKPVQETCQPRRLLRAQISAARRDRAARRLRALLARRAGRALAAGAQALPAWQPSPQIDDGKQKDAPLSGSPFRRRNE